MEGYPADTSSQRTQTRPTLDPHRGSPPWRHFLDPESGKLIDAESAIENIPKAKGRSKDEVIQDTAVLYTYATLVGARPLKLVADVLGVSHSTATRLAASARTAGLLDAEPVLESPEGMTIEEVRKRLALPRKAL